MYVGILFKLYIHATVPYFIIYPSVGAVTFIVHAGCQFPSYVYVSSFTVALIVPFVTVNVNVALPHL